MRIYSLNVVSIKYIKDRITDYSIRYNYKFTLYFTTIWKHYVMNLQVDRRSQSETLRDKEKEKERGEIKEIRESTRMREKEYLKQP